jgi:hypothetical protein
VVSADLYYNWLKLGSFYGQPDSLLTNYMKMKDSLGFEQMLKADSTGTLYLKALEDKNLLNSPYIYLRTDNGETFTLFMNSKDYKNFTKFNYHELTDQNLKVRVEVEIDSIWKQMYYCSELISVNLLEGQTLQRERKFKIEEYR